MSLFSFDFRYDDNRYETESSIKQAEVEDSVGNIYLKSVDPDTIFHGGDIDDSHYRLHRSRHEQYIRDSLEGLPSGFVGFDASQPWFSFWSLNSLDIMGCEIDGVLRRSVVETVRKFQCIGGGFGGGNRQIAHLAASYASVMSLVIIGGNDAYELIDRDGMYKWLMSMKREDGSFYMHENGEVDVRGIYCAMVIASLLNIMTPELIHNVAEFVSSCQTWEGGIGPYPGVEAHGGYTLCGIAALEILGKTDALDLDRLAHWASYRQLAFEGGFNGRTNKLVDGCYSYWMGGVFPILQKALKRRCQDGYLYNRACLQRYILACCQGKKGGLRDKPGKSPDLYHTMYCLTGLSLSQHYVGVEPEEIVADINSVYSTPMRMMQWGMLTSGLDVLGHRSNLVKPVHPVYNIPFVPLANCVKFFYSLQPLCNELVSGKTDLSETS